MQKSTPLVTGEETRYDESMNSGESNFPTNFLWGAGGSAHQVEGNNHNDWTEWEKLGRVNNGERSGLSADHFHRFRDDFAVAKKLGHNAHRFSIEWSRVEPKPGIFNQEAIDHYRQVLEELRRLDIEPIVTLHHFTNPTWIADRGGWVQAETIDRFGRYVEMMTQRLGHLVNYWVTINEPTVYSSLSYVTGYWPPQRKSYVSAWLAIRHLAKAHDLAYRIIHRRFPSTKVGSANNLIDFVPFRPDNPFDHFLRFFAHYWHNQWWLDQTSDTQDFIGLNYYFHHPLKFRLTWPLHLFEPIQRGDRFITDIGWPIAPDGLGRLLQWLKQYRRPIIITENGLADRADTKRAAFIRAHVAQINQARQHGIDVHGYLYWSLLDNFEWREGFNPRFGLIDVDYQTQQRTIRPSAYAFKELILQQKP